MNFSTAATPSLMTQNQYTELTNDKLKMCYKVNLQAVEQATKTEDFDPFLKVNFIYNCFEIGIQSLRKNLDFVTISTLNAWKGIILTNMANENYNHFHHATYLLNIVKFEIFCSNYPQAAGLIPLAINVAKNFQESHYMIPEIRSLKEQMYKKISGSV